MHILIVTGLHGFVHHCNEFFVHRKIRETLSKVDGPVFRRERTHDGKDGRAHLGQLALNRNRHGMRFGDRSPKIRLSCNMDSGWGYGTPPGG